ncbi:zinc-dependent metalloprotease, partial [Acinetobacter baumannii]
MHRVGRTLVPGYENLHRRMAYSRAHRPPLETAILRLLGLDTKLEQYRLGERFSDAVARRQGMRGLNRVWERPENLP